MSCSMKYNCCQQADLCPSNKVCKPRHSPSKPWKRFTCVCRDGYHGNHCDQPIMSCKGYAKGSRKSGVYKLVGPRGTVYDAYCFFYHNFVSTLVQSYSFANRSLEQFQNPLFKNLSVSENDPTWRGYRLSKSRMKFIKDDSTFLMFTCDYEKNDFDYLRFSLQDIKIGSGSVDVIEFTGFTSSIYIANGHGKIGESELTGCECWLEQEENIPFHVHIFQCIKLRCIANNYFGNFPSSYGCQTEHRCVQNVNSTTQLWFGTKD